MSHWPLHTTSHHSTLSLRRSAAPSRTKNRATSQGPKLTCFSCTLHIAVRIHFYSEMLGSNHLNGCTLSHAEQRSCFAQSQIQLTIAPHQMCNLLMAIFCFPCTGCHGLPAKCRRGAFSCGASFALRMESRQTPSALTNACFCGHATRVGTRSATCPIVVIRSL